MGIIARLFGSGPQTTGGESNGEHAVILRIQFPEESPTEAEQERLFGIQDELGAAIERAGVGEFDGDEWGGGCCTIFMYGPDADRLWDAIAPLLERHPFARGSCAVRRYGPPGAREDRVSLEWAGR